MGLANYVIFQVPIDVKVPKSFEHLRNNNGDYELSYWWKCYQVRNEILSIAEEFYDDALRQYEIPKENIPILIKALKRFNRYNWSPNVYDPWPSAKKKLRLLIKRLKKLRYFRGEYRLLFIDSY